MHGVGFFVKDPKDPNKPMPEGTPVAIFLRSQDGKLNADGTFTFTGIPSVGGSAPIDPRDLVVEVVMPDGVHVLAHADARGDDQNIVLGGEAGPSDIAIPFPKRGYPPHPPIPDPPSRTVLLTGQVSLNCQLRIHVDGYGEMPWWGACWAWLTKEQRKQAAEQLIAAGEEICVIQYPDGRPLYDEAGQFYSADKFPALLWTMEQMAELVEESLQLGFKGCWVFLGGDDGNNGGFFESDAQVKDMGAVFSNRPRNLCEYVVPLPGWDGVWHKPGGGGTGYTPQQLRQFSLDAKAAGFKYVGVEGGTGYLLCGEGGGDYLPGGAMSAYSLILSEYDDGKFETGDVWQIMARYLGPSYIRPPEQNAHDVEGDPLYPEAHDPNPTYVLKPMNEDNDPYIHRVFEYYIYGGVRGTPPTEITISKAKFESMGAQNVC